MQLMKMNRRDIRNDGRLALLSPSELAMAIILYRLNGEEDAREFIRKVTDGRGKQQALL